MNIYIDIFVRKDARITAIHKSFISSLPMLYVYFLLTSEEVLGKVFLSSMNVWFMCDSRNSKKHFQLLQKATFFIYPGDLCRRSYGFGFHVINHCHKRGTFPFSLVKIIHLFICICLKRVLTFILIQKLIA